MEITTVSSFLDYYQKIKSRTDKLVHLIPASHLESHISAGRFSCGDLIRHIVTIERFMYAEVVEGRPSSYQGCGRELADGYEEVITFYHRLRRESLDIFSRLTDDDLMKKCVTPIGALMTLWKWLRALVEHEIHHRGQLYTTLGYIGIAAPPIFGLTAEELQKRSLYGK